MSRQVVKKVLKNKAQKKPLSASKKKCPDQSDDTENMKITKNIAQK